MRFDFRFDNYSVATLASSGVVEPFEERIHKQQKTCKLMFPILLPLLAIWRVQRIMTELLNNACKYTFRSRTKFTVTADAQRSIIAGRWAIPVSKFLPINWSAFLVVLSRSNSDFSNQSGTGLGLVLVKLVEKLGWVKFFCVY